MGVGALQGESKKKWWGRGKKILQINNILSLGGGGGGEGGREKQYSKSLHGNETKISHYL